MDHRTLAALDVVAALKQAPDQASVIRILRAFGESFGFGHFCLTDLPADPNQQPHYYDAWPYGWGAHYLANDLIRHDPVFRAMHVATEPFVWSDVVRVAPGTPEARVMELAKEGWGMHDGYAVPILSLTGAQASISFACDREHGGRENLPGLHLAAIYAYLRFEELSGRECPDHARAACTMREREALALVATGRDDEAVARRLNLSEAATTSVLHSAVRKLGARTRTQAIVRAMGANLFEM